MLYVTGVGICELGCVKDSVRAAMSTPKLPYFSVLAASPPPTSICKVHSKLTTFSMFHEIMERRNLCILNAIAVDAL